MNKKAKQREARKLQGLTNVELIQFAQLVLEVWAETERVDRIVWDTGESVSTKRAFWARYWDDSRFINRIRELGGQS